MNDESLQDGATLSLTLRPRAVLNVLAAGAVILLGLHYVGLAFDRDGGRWSENIRRLSDLNDELSIGTWYSSGLLLSAAAASFVAARRDRSDRRMSWYLLTAAFTFLSADEAASIHEMGDGLHDALGIDTATTFLWTVPYGLAGLGLAWIILPFLKGLPRETLTLLLVSAVVYVGAAIGLELLAAFFREIEQDSLVDHVTIPIEEAAEMLGVTIFIVGVIAHVGRIPAADRTLV